MAVSLIRRIFTISLLYKTAQEGTSKKMQGHPLHVLVELAAVFHTSVAVTGQLTAATAITWALTAFLAGPVSDIYGRRRMLLTGLMLMVLGTLRGYPKSVDGANIW
jgi:MFS family permease